MKKILSAIFAVVLLFSLSGCHVIGGAVFQRLYQSTTASSQLNQTESTASVQSQAEASDISEEQLSLNGESKAADKVSVASSKATHTHSFRKATCTAPQKCTCGATQGKALGHSFQNGKCTRCSAVTANYNKVLEGSAWQSNQGALSNGVAYYTYSGVSTLYAYNGSSTKEIPIVGYANLMIADDDHVYYLDSDSKDIYRVNIKTEKCELFFSAPGDIYEFFKFNNTVYVSADNENNYELLYSVNATTKVAKVAVPTPAKGSTPLNIRLSDSVCYCMFRTSSKIYFQKLDLKTGKVSEATKEETSDAINQNYKLPDIENFRNATELLTDKDDVSFRTEKHKINGYYYFVALWQEASWDGDDQYWNITESMMGKLIRISSDGSKHEFITDIDAPNWVTMFTADSNRLLYLISDVKSNKKYVYLSDLNGNNLKCISARANKKTYLNADAEQLANSITAKLQSGVTTDQPQNSGQQETCDICGGDGRETCTFCHGTGKGQTIDIMGIPTPQGCTYCGSSGWRVCSQCNGYGVK